MEKLRYENQSSKANLWDCGSTLYDSFELNSFRRQLDSAIANSSRTMSMPRLPDRRVLPLQPPPPKKPFNISRSLHKFLRSVFKPNNKTSSPGLFQSQKSKDRYYVVYDKSGPVLSTIPEVPEFEIAAVSPEISSFVGRSASERFTPTTIGIQCA